MLQELGGYYDSFTVLYLHPIYIKLHKLRFSLIHQFYKELMNPRKHELEPLAMETPQIVFQIAPWIETAPDKDQSKITVLSICALTAQFLLLALPSRTPRPGGGELSTWTTKFDLLAYPEDVLDTWGPSKMIPVAAPCPTGPGRKYGQGFLGYRNFDGGVKNFVFRPFPEVIGTASSWMSDVSA
jgi:hypothetical protein